MDKKVYITSSNFHKILRNNDLINKEKGEILYSYKNYNLNFLSFSFLRKLNKHKLFLEQLTNDQSDFYVALKKEFDTYSKIIETNIPSYHLSKDCETMNSTFENYYIPYITKSTLGYRANSFIKQYSDNCDFLKILEEKKGIKIGNEEFKNLKEENISSKYSLQFLSDRIYQKEIFELRDWFLKNKKVLDTNKSNFDLLFREKFNLINEFNEPDEKYEGSGALGAIEMENLSLKEIENKLDHKLGELNNFLDKQSSEKKVILRVLGNKFYHIKGLIKNNNPEQENIEELLEEYEIIFWRKIYTYHKIKNFYDKYTAKELYQFLSDYDKDFITPISSLLSYHISYSINKQFIFSEPLLEKLGFRVCKKCEEELYRN